MHFIWKLDLILILATRCHYQGVHLISVCTSSENLTYLCTSSENLTYFWSWPPDATTRGVHLISVCTSSENMSSLWNILLLYRGLFYERPISYLICNNSMVLQLDLCDVGCLRYLFQKICHYIVHLESSGTCQKCCVENVSCVIHRYCDIPLVSLIKNAKIWSIHPVKSSITIVSKRWGCWLLSFMHGAWGHPVTLSRLTSLCAGAWGHPVTLSWLTSMCAGVQGHPVTSSQLTSNICQGQSMSGHHQVHHQGLVWVYLSSIRWDDGLLLWAE